jgi:hypothetical protein
MAVADDSAQVSTRRPTGRKTLIFILLAPVLTFFFVFNTIPILWLLGLNRPGFTGEFLVQ